MVEVDLSEVEVELVRGIDIDAYVEMQFMCDAVYFRTVERQQEQRGGSNKEGATETGE